MKVKNKKQGALDIIVSDTDQVRLTVQIGEAQIGGSIVQFKDDPNIISKGDVNGVLIGNGADIKGKTLQVTTNVLDINPATRNISINHNFSAGNPNSASLRDKVDTAGDIFSWVTSYNFK